MCPPLPHYNGGKKRLACLSQLAPSSSSPLLRGKVYQDAPLDKYIVLTFMLLIGATINKLKIYMCVLYFVKVEAVDSFISQLNQA